MRGLCRCFDFVAASLARMPSAARVLTLIVSICHTVQAGRLSAMGTHLLRHFARNHGRQNTVIFGGFFALFSFMDLFSFCFCCRHDSFFAAMASRKPSYKCLVHSCTTLFANSYERSLHLQNIHLFPKNFCYDRQKRTKTQRKTKTQTKMKTNGSSTNQNSNQSSNGYVTSNVDELSNQMSQISFGRNRWYLDCDLV